MNEATKSSSVLGRGFVGIESTPERDKSLVEIALDTLQNNVDMTAHTINDLAARLSTVLQSRDGEEKVSGGPRNVASCKLEERITDIQADVVRLHSVIARLRDTLCV